MSQKKQANKDKTLGSWIRDAVCCICGASCGSGGLLVKLESAMKKNGVRTLLSANPGKEADMSVRTPLLP